MGWLVKRQQAEEPSALITIVTKLMDQQADQQRQMNQLVQSMLQVQSEQNAMTRELLSQYVVKGENTTTNLNDRLFDQEQDTDWEPMAEDPFQLLGLGE